MIFTCPTCSIAINARMLPVHCCGVSHDETSPAISDGELPPRVRKPRPLRTIGACTHRGDELRREACASCGGNVQIKVLSCEIHGECTIAKRLAGVACCQGCTSAFPG